MASPLTTPVPFDINRLPAPTAQLLEHLANTQVPKDVIIDHCFGILRTNLQKLKDALACFGALKTVLLNHPSRTGIAIGNRRQGEEAFAVGRASEVEIWRTWYWIYTQIQALQLRRDMGGDKGQLVVECLAQMTMLKWYAGDVTLLQGMVARLPLHHGPHD